MISGGSLLRFVGLTAAMGLAACAGRTESRVTPTTPPLPPPLPVEDLAPAPTADERQDPAMGQDPGPPVTFTAQNADVRQVLTLLAAEAGVSLILSPEIGERRINVHFERVPAREALDIVLEAAGLSVETPTMEAPWGPAIFYPLPVNLDAADVGTIQTRFGVSREMAQWIVRARVP